MSQFNFTRLIKKYSKNPVYAQTETAGCFDYTNGGEWVPGVKTWVPFEGAVLPLNNQDLVYGAGGTYTTKDRILYSYNTFIKGSKIKHKEIEYTIDQDKDYVDFDADLMVYFIVSAV